MISPNDQQLILAKALGLPPASLLEKCKTLDQVEEWNNVKRIFQDVYISLKAYFSGQKNPISNISDIYSLQVQRYIDLYNLIWSSWEDIEYWAKKKNEDIPRTPGEYLAEILEDDCKIIFCQCLEYTEFRPRKLYNFSGEYSKVEALKTKKQLNPKESKKIEVFERQINKQRHNYQQYLALHDFVICVAKYSGKHQKMLKRYESTCLDLEKTIMKRLHPRKATDLGFKGFNWEKGEKRYIS